MTRLEELVDMKTLQRLAREGSGRGVRVAIVDTGVEVEHPALEGAVKSSHEVVFQGRRLMCRPSRSGDPVGHGTACAGIIHSLAPQAELHSLRVIGRDASGTLDQLIFGLRWAIEQKMDIINLSLGTVQKRQISTMQELIDRAYYNGQIVVAAANNHRQVCYPAYFASLVAVDNQAFDDPEAFHYRLGEPIELVAHGIYVKAPSPGGGYRWFTGTSFACPHISGLTARLRSEMPGLTPFQLKSLLWCLRHNADS